ncbi:hypothetical protein J4219_06570 [Candidatus Woesearchaeota archaeon]|nr:hypothetical protein [Candidatus Woesearchaeota archaeon]
MILLIDLTNVIRPPSLEQLLIELPVTFKLTQGAWLNVDLEDEIIYIEPQNGYLFEIEPGVGATAEASDEHTLLVGYKQQLYAFSYRQQQKPF